MLEFLGTLLTTPLFWIGVASATIPVILHMVYRRRAPRIRFSTLRFIRASAERTARRRRIRDWLLLLLRSAAIFCLALALTAPPLRALAFGSRGGDLAAAVVLDNSYSMAAELAQTSHYARARDFVVKLLDALPADVPVAVVYAWPPTGEARLADQLTTHREGLADAVSRSEVSAVPGDLAGAVVRAEQILAKSPAHEHEIYIFSDLQKATWRPFPARSVDIAPTLFVVDCAVAERENVALTALELDAVRPAAGVPLTIKARTRNFGRRPREGRAMLYVGRSLAAERAIAVDPGAETEVAFSVAFPKPGVHTGWVDVETGDVLSFDNRRYFAVVIPERIRVGVVRPEPGAVPLLDEAFFLAPALNPTGAGVASPIEPDLLLQKDLVTGKLGDYRVLFLLNLPELTAAERRALAGFLAGGGSVVIFPGDRVKREAWNAMLASSVASERGILPARLGGVLEPDEGDGASVVLETAEFDHPVFAPFRGLPPGFFRSVAFKRYFVLEPVEGGGARVLARLSDGHPFLVERAAGNGRTMLFCAPATSAWSNLPTRKLYLALLHQITYYLAQGPGARGSVRPGQTVRFPVRPGPQSEAQRAIEVTDPMGVRRATVLETSLEGSASLVFQDTARPGIYTWRDRVTGEQGAFAVNVDPAEGDLAAWTTDEIARKLLNGRTAHFARSAGEALDVARRLREGLQLRVPLLLLVTALLLIECILANQVSPEKRDVRLLAAEGAGAAIRREPRGVGSAH